MERIGRPPGTAAGVGRGDVVAVLLYNSIELIDLMRAAAHLGAIIMPLNWRLAGPELEYIVNHAGANVLISEREFDAADRAGADPPSAASGAARRGRLGRALDGAQPSPEGGRGRPRRRAPPDVHLRHDVAAEGRDDHATATSTRRTSPRRSSWG